MQARVAWCALVALAAAAAHDFEFDEPSAAESERRGRPRRYLYDPHSPLCSALVCRKREVCLLRDAHTALCAHKKDVLKKGDVIVPAGAWAGAGAGAGAARSPGGTPDEEDDVFYEGGAELPAPAPAHAHAPRADRCVGCDAGVGGGAGFLCGSDNRTYSSLCRLDLHNCVRRGGGAPPVALACRGACPCRSYSEVSRRSHTPPGARAGWEESSGSAGGGCALDTMADRLVDWFSVVMEEARAVPPPSAGFPGGCKGEVRWMFAHLDADADGALSPRELYALRHDERERCLRPFLASCGARGVSRGVSRAAWCGCLRRAARPCAALARAARARGGWAPACDARGYYRPRQCHAALAQCWCVDAHGQEVAGSRTRGAPACRRVRVSRPATPPAPPADDEDAPGSGDGAPDMRY